MPQVPAPLDVYRKFYWLYREVHGTPHPDEFEWALNYEEKRDTRQEVQMGWAPHDAPVEPGDCWHPYLARAWCSFAAKGVRINYALCDRCGTVVHPDQDSTNDESPFLCSN